MRGCITKKGSTYSFVVDIGKDKNGKRQQKWYNGFKTKKEAQKELARILHELETGTFISPDKLTLGEYLDHWYDCYVKTNLKPVTAASYSYLIEKHIKPTIGDMLIQKLQPIHIQQLYKDKMENGRLDGKGGLSAKSVLYIHRILREAMNHALKMQLVQRNIVDFVEAPKQKKYKASFLDVPQVQKLLEAVRETGIYIPILLAVGLGLRRGEALGLQWKDIDFENGTIYINRSLLPYNKGVIFETPKSEKSIRIISVSGKILEELKKHKEKQEIVKSIMGQAYLEDDLVNCYPNGAPINPATFSHLFADVLEKNNLPHIRFHDLRHTNATLMLKQNIPAKVASERLGHSTVGITLDLYSHVMREMQEDAANKLENVLFGNDNSNKDAE